MMIKMTAAAVCLLAASVFSQSFRVDSVRVDSVWNSDSTWLDWRGNPKSRTSRDCNVSFFVAGSGTAACSVFVSFDGASTWRKDSVSVLAPVSMILNCNVKSQVRIRVLGGDRTNTSVRVKAQQYKVAITGAPKMAGFDPFGRYPTDTLISARLAVRSTNADSSRGGAPIVKVWWDTNGSGVWNDSTTAADRLFSVHAPVKGTMHRDTVFAKARDALGMWSAPETLYIQFGLTDTFKFVELRDTTFRMGNAEYGPIHNVTLSPFAIMNIEVTQEQYLLATGTNPSFHTGNLLKPIENETWYEAVLFCNALSKKAKLDTCYTYTSQTYTGGICTDLPGIDWDTSVNAYRLPSEAEWEYACRGRTTTNYFWGDEVDTAYFWYSLNSGGATHVARQRLPNAYGLYDMSGNVWEWTWDWYHDYDPAGIALVNPEGWPTGTEKVNRGGSYGQEMTGYFMSGFRNPTSPPYLRGRINGFRIVISR